MRSFFATNVPYNLPTFGQDWNFDHFNVLDGDVIVFKPREWRGTNGGRLKIILVCRINVDTLLFNLKKQNIYKPYTLFNSRATFTPFSGFLLKS